jgi:hypothetical protein
VKQLPRSGRSKICKFIRDAVAVLERLRVLAAELVFTAAAFHGLYHVFRVLIGCCWADLADRGLRRVRGVCTGGSRLADDSVWPLNWFAQRLAAKIAPNGQDSEGPRRQT